MTSFNDSKGFGFIYPDEGGESLFAHYSEIVDGSRSPKEGQKVSFDVKPGSNGKRATNIQAR